LTTETIFLPPTNQELPSQSVINVEDLIESV